MMTAFGRVSCFLTSFVVTFNHPMVIQGQCYHPDYVVVENKCYGLIDERNWTAARDACRALGGDLASIHNSGENDVIKNLPRHSAYGNVWIGLNDIDMEMRFEWSDGTLYDYHLPWVIGQPDDVYGRNGVHYRGGADCVTMDNVGLGQWHDRACFMVFPACSQEMVIQTMDIMPSRLWVGPQRATVKPTAAEAASPMGINAKGLSLRHTQCYGRQGNSVTATDTCLTQDQGRLPVYPSVTPVYPVYPSENLLSTEGGQNVLHPLQSVESNVTNGRTDKIARHSLATPMADGWMLKNNHAQAITSQLSTTHSENHQHLVTTEYGAIGKMSSPAKLAGPNETAPIQSPMDSTGCPTTSSIEYNASVNPTDQSNHCTGQLVQQNSSTLYGHILGTRFHGIPVSFSPVYATAGSTISITTDSICSMNRLPSTGSYRPPAHPDYPVTILSSALPSNAQADKCVSAGFRSPSVNSAAVEPDFNCIVSQNDMGTVDFLQSENALSTGELGLEIMDVFSLARLDGQTRNPLHDLADSLWDSCNNKDQGQRNSFTRVDSPTKCASTQETFHSEKLQKNIQAIEILFLDDTGKSLRCFSADGELEIIEGPSDLLGAPDNRTASTASPQERSSVVSKPRYSWDQSGSRPDDTKAKMVEFSITVDHIETEPDASKETQKSPARKMFSIQADNKSAFNSMHITECNKEMYFFLSGNTRHVVFRVPDTIFKCLHQEEVEKYCQVRIQVDVPKMSSDNNVAAVMKDRMSIVINPIFTKTMVKTEGQKSQLLQDSSVFCGSSTERDIFCPTITESTKASMNPDSLRRSQRSAPGRTLLCEQPRKRKRTSYHRKVSPKPARATHNSHHSSESAYEKDDFKNVFCKADHDRRIHKLREKIWHQEADLENLRNAKKDQQKISNGTNL